MKATRQTALSAASLRALGKLLARPLVAWRADRRCRVPAMASGAGGLPLTALRSAIAVATCLWALVPPASAIDDYFLVMPFKFYKSSQAINGDAPNTIRQVYASEFEAFFRENSYGKYTVDTVTYDYVHLPWPKTNGSATRGLNFNPGADSTNLITGAGEDFAEAANTLWGTGWPYHGAEAQVLDMAWTPGERFKDTNGDGRYTYADPWWDVEGAPLNTGGITYASTFYTNSDVTNCNDARGEWYIDLNGDGAYQSSVNITIWSDAAGATVNINGVDEQRPGLVIGAGTGQGFLAFDGRCTMQAFNRWGERHSANDLLTASDDARRTTLFGTTRLVGGGRHPTTGNVTRVSSVVVGTVARKTSATATDNLNVRAVDEPYVDESPRNGDGNSQPNGSWNNREPFEDFLIRWNYTNNADPNASWVKVTNQYICDNYPGVTYEGLGAGALGTGIVDGINGNAVLLGLINSQVGYQHPYDTSTWSGEAPAAPLLYSPYPHADATANGIPDNIEELIFRSGNGDASVTYYDSVTHVRTGAVSLRANFRGGTYATPLISRYDGPEYFNNVGNTKIRVMSASTTITTGLDNWDYHGFYTNFAAWWQQTFPESVTSGGGGAIASSLYTVAPYDQAAARVNSPDGGGGSGFIASSTADAVAHPFPNNNNTGIGGGNVLPDSNDVYYDGAREFRDMPSSMYHRSGDGRLSEQTDPRTTTTNGHDYGSSDGSGPFPDFRVCASGPLAYDIIGDYGLDAGNQLAIELASWRTDGTSFTDLAVSNGSRVGGWVGSDTAARRCRDNNLDGLVDQGESPDDGYANYIVDLHPMTSPDDGTQQYPYNRVRVWEDVVEANDRSVDFEQYTEGGAYAGFIMALYPDGYAGRDFQPLSGGGASILTRDRNTLLSFGGQVLNVSASEGPTAGPGRYAMSTLAHEYSHDHGFGGDLYDYDSFNGIRLNYPMGGMDIMAASDLTHYYPGHKKGSGWIEERDLAEILTPGAAQVLSLYDVETTENQYYVIYRPDGRERYWFYFEGGGSTYFDKIRGMYIVREDLGQNGEAIPLQRVGTHFSTELIQADGLNQMQEGVSTTFNGADVWPGTLNKTTFNATTTPAAVWNDGTDIQLEIIDIMMPAAGTANPLRVVFKWKGREVPELTFTQPPGGESVNGVYTTKYDAWDNYGGTRIRLFRDDDDTGYNGAQIGAQVGKIAGDVAANNTFSVAALADGSYRLYALLLPWADPQYDGISSAGAGKGVLTIQSTQYVPTQQAWRFTYDGTKFVVLGSGVDLDFGTAADNNTTTLPITPGTPGATSDGAFTFAISTGVAAWVAGDTITFTPKYEQKISSVHTAYTNTGNGTCAVRRVPVIDPSGIMADNSTFQSWKATCTTSGSTGVARFQVVGSVTGVAGVAVAGQDFSSGVGNHTGNFQIRITAGSVNFGVGDSFTFRTTGLTPYSEAFPVLNGEVPKNMPGTDDPLHYDSDGDGLADYWEYGYFDDLTSTDGALALTDDADGDGLSDYYEFLAGTDPVSLADSNFNGILDRNEDPDGDGLSNLEEQTALTHPLLADTDDDGEQDGAEVGGGGDATDSLLGTGGTVNYRALDFTDSAAEHVELPDKARFGLTSWTIEGWVQPDAIGAGKSGHVLSRVLGTAPYVHQTDFTFIDSNPDAIRRAAGSFVEDGFVVGQGIQVAGGLNDGTYFRVLSVTDKNLTLTATDAVVPGSILRSDIAFVDSNPDTITTVAGDFLTAGFRAGQTVKVAGGANNGRTFTIAAGGATSVALTLVGADAVVAETAGTAITLTEGTVGTTDIGLFANQLRRTDFVFTAPATIGSSDASFTFTAAGFAAGQWLRVTGGANDGRQVRVQAVAADGKTLTLDTEYGAVVNQATGTATTLARVYANYDLYVRDVADPLTPDATDLQVVAEFGDGEGTPVQVTSGARYLVDNGNTWAHVAATFDATSSLLSLYVNGVLVGVRNALPVTPVTAGSEDMATHTRIGEGFDGRIDDVRIWDRSRTAGQITGAKSVTLAGNDANLVAYYRLDDSTFAAVCWRDAEAVPNGVFSHLTDQAWLDADSDHLYDTGETVLLDKGVAALTAGMSGLPLPATCFDDLNQDTVFAPGEHAWVDVDRDGTYTAADVPVTLEAPPINCEGVLISGTSGPAAFVTGQVEDFAAAYANGWLLDWEEHGTLYGDTTSLRFVDQTAANRPVDDAVAPAILSVNTEDSDADGLLDRVRVVFSEPVVDTTFNVSQFVLRTSAGYTYAGLSFPAPDQSVDFIDDNTIVLSFTERTVTDVKTDFDTGATPDLVATNATVADLAGNLLGTVTTRATDTAAPVVADVNSYRGLQGVSPNQYLESGTILEVTFSEPMTAAAAYTLADLATDMDGVGGVALASPAFAPASANLVLNGRVLTVTLTGDTVAGWEADATFNLAAPTLPALVDAAGSALKRSAADVPIRRLQRLQITSVTALDSDLNGYLDGVALVFNLPIRDSTLTGYPPADGEFLSVAATGDNWQLAGRTNVRIDLNGPANNDVANNNTLYLVFDETGADTDSKPQLTIANDPAVQASTGEVMDNGPAVATTDGAAPQVMDVTTLDTDGDGKVDAADLVFSEPATGLAPGDYYIGNQVVDSITGDGSTKAVRLVLLPANEVAGTDLKPVRYLKPAILGTTDRAVPAVPLATAATAGTRNRSDGAKPVIATARTLDDSSIEVAFSEPVSSVGAGDLAVNAATGPGAVTFSTVTPLALPPTAAYVWSGASARWNTDATGLSAGDTDNSDVLGLVSTDSLGIPRNIKPTLYVPVNALIDGGGNFNAVVDGLTLTTDGAAPVAVVVETQDAAPTDGFVDTAVITFSEPLLDATVSFRNFRLGGLTATAFATGTGNDQRIVVTHGGVSGTDYKTVAYAYTGIPGTLRLTDAAGNPMPDTVADLGTKSRIDNAAPRIALARTLSDRSVEVTFTEALDASTVAAGDLVADPGAPDIAFSGVVATASPAVFVWSGAATTWNTDATGGSTGSGSDSQGNLCTAKPALRLAGSSVADAQAIGNAPAGQDFAGTTDGAPPVVTAVGSGVADGSKVTNAGANVPVVVTFSEVVTVSGGVPALSVQVTETTTRAVGYTQGSGTRALSFFYTVVSGDNRIAPNYLDYDGANALTAGANVIRDGAANSANLTLPTTVVSTVTRGALFAHQITIDTIGPKVLSARMISRQRVEVTLDEAVADGTVQASDFAFTSFATAGVNGTPAGWDTGTAGNDAVVVLYTAAELPETEASGRVAYSGANLVKDALNGYDNLVTPTPVAVAALADAIAITAPLSGAILSADTDVDGRAVMGAPGTSAWYLLIAQGTTPAPVDFEPLANGVNDPAGGTFHTLALASLTEQTYTLRLRVVNPDPLVAGTDETPVDTDVIIGVDTEQPWVLGVVSTDGVYGVDAHVLIDVWFSEDVVVTGTPTLDLAVSPALRTATYVGGSGTQVLTFDYLVAAPDSAADLDYDGTDSLALAGGTIQDVAGNDADLTLPAPGDPWSLGDMNDVVIDTTGPIVQIFTPTQWLAGQPWPTRGQYNYMDDGSLLVSARVVSAGSALLDVSVSVDTGSGPAATLLPAFYNDVTRLYECTLNLSDQATWFDADLRTPWNDGTYTIDVIATDESGEQTIAQTRVIYSRDLPKADILGPYQDELVSTGREVTATVIVAGDRLDATGAVDGTWVDWTLEGDTDPLFSNPVGLGSGTDAGTYTVLFTPDGASGDLYYLRLTATDDDGGTGTVVHRMKVVDGITDVAVGDTDGNGLMDCLYVSFGEAVDIVDANGPADGFDAVTVDGGTYPVIAADYADSDTTTLTLVLGEGAVLDTGVTPVVDFINNLDIVLHGSPTEEIPDVSMAAVDQAKPLVLSAQTRSDSSVAVTFTEPVANPLAGALTVAGGTIEFAAATVDPADPCTVVWSGARLVADHATAASWNTDATGSGPGAGTDSAGVQRNVTVTISGLAAGAVTDAQGGANANAVDAVVAGTTLATLVTDGAPPVAVAARYLDAVAPWGQVDRAEITFSEPVIFAYEAADWSVAAAGDIGLAAVTGPVSNVNGVVTLAVTAAANVTGGPTAPQIAYADAGVPGSLTDGANAAAGFPLTLADGVAPVLLRAETADAGGAAGQIDEVTLFLSEPVDVVDGNLADGLPGFAVVDGAYTYAVAAGNYAVADVTQVTLALTERGTPDTAAVPAVSYDGTSVDAVTDRGALALELRDGAALQGTLDKAPPAAVSARYLDAVAPWGQVDRFEVTFSEPVTFAYDGADWSVAAAGGIGLAGVTGVVSNANGVVTLAVTAAVNVTGGAVAPTVRYTDAGTASSLRDGANPVAGFTRAGDDAAAPLLVSAAMATQTVVEVVFTEDVDGTSVQGQDFTHSVRSVVPGNAAILDLWQGARLTLTAAMPLSGAATIALVQAGAVADPHGNASVGTVAVAVAPLASRIYLNAPDTATVHYGAAQVFVGGLCQAENGGPGDDADDLASWAVYLVPGHGAARLPVTDALSVLLPPAADPSLPLVPAGDFASFVPAADTTPDQSRYTAVLVVHFTTGEPDLEVYRELVITAGAPVQGEVGDGLAAGDIDFQVENDRLAANWAEFANGPVPVCTAYQWAAGTDADPAVMEVFAWRDAQTNLSAMATGLTLTSGSTYYVFVRALNAQGAVLAWSVSDGVTVDRSAPVMGAVRDGNDPTQDLDLVVVGSLDTLQANWDAAADGGSGLDTYLVRWLTGTAAAGWTAYDAPTPQAIAQGRTQFAAVQVDARRALLIGGWKGTAAVSSTELYDTTSHTWTAVGALTEARYSLAAACLPGPDPVVLAVGGSASGTYRSTVERLALSAAAPAWERIGSLASPREGAVVVPLDATTAWVLGGRGLPNPAVPTDIRYLTSVEQIDLSVSPPTTTAVAGVALGEGRAGAQVVATGDGRYFVIGGQTATGHSRAVDVVWFDPTLPGWTVTRGPSLLTGRSNFAVALLPNGQILVAGGQTTGTGGATERLASAELLDPAVGVVRAAASMAYRRASFSAVSLPGDEKVLVVGGIGKLASAPAGNTDVALVTTEVYDPLTDTWQVADDLHGSRAYHRLFLFGDGAVVAAGGLVSNVFSRTTEATRFLVPVCDWQATTSRSLTKSGLPLDMSATYYAQVRAQDDLGNLSAPRLSDGIRVDLAEPVAVLQNAPAALTDQTSAVVTVAGAGVIQYRQRLDGGAWGATTAVATPISLSGLADGLHTLDVVAGDAYGQWQADAAATRCTWTVDTQDLTVVVESLSGSSSHLAPVRFAVQFSKAVADFAAVDVTVGNGDVAAVTAVSASRYEVDVTPRGDGVVTAALLVGVAHDALGRGNVVSNTVSVTYYSQPLAVVTLAGPAEVVLGAAGTADFDVSVYVKENSGQATGFRGGPLDVSFTAALAQFRGVFSAAQVVQAPFRSLGTSGTLGAGLIDELGGVTTANGLGETAPGALYAVIPFTASAAGVFTAAAAPAQAGLVLTPPVGVLPVGAADYGQPLRITVVSPVTLSAVGGAAELAEGGAPVVLRVALPAPAVEAVTVTLGFAGLAVPGVDYLASATSVVLAAGQVSADVVLTAVDDALVEGPLTVVVTVANVASASGAYREVVAQECDLVLTDNDAAPGDLDGSGDGVVGSQDLFYFIGAYGSAAGDANYNAAADFDHDGDVDYYDLVQFIGYYTGDPVRRGGRDEVAVEASVTGDDTRATRAWVTLQASATTVTVGDTFTVDVLVRVDDSKGFGGGTVDVQFTTALASYHGAFVRTEVVQAPYNEMPLFTFGSLNEAAGLVDELGGSHFTQDGLGYGTPVRYVRLTFVADEAGDVTFAAAGQSVFSIPGGGTIPVTEISFGQSVLVHVNAAANQPPVAQAGSVFTPQGVAVDVSLVAEDADGDALRFAVPAMGEAGYPVHGTLSVPRSQTHGVRYTPAADFVGEDAFTFTAADATHVSVPATVTVRVGGFASELVVERGGVSYIALDYGLRWGTASGFAPADGDYLAPPSGTAGDAAAFLLPTGERLARDYRPVGPATVWALEVGVPGAAARETWAVSWDSAGLPAAWAFSLTPAGAGWAPAGAAIDMAAIGHVDLAYSGSGAQTFRFLLQVTARDSLAYHLAAGWNLIGVPLELDAASQAAILDHADILGVWGWNALTAAYVVPDALEPGHGYWVYARQALTICVTGLPAAGPTALLAGWNLVSPVAPAANPVGTEAAVIGCWGWTTAEGYAIPDEASASACSPVAGYWVYAVVPVSIWP